MSLAEKEPKYKNKAMCRLCKDTIESKHRHDFVTCKCGAISLDGGNDYWKLVGDLKNIIRLMEPLEEKK